MSSDHDIKLCSIVSSDTVLKFLIETLDISKNQIKKQKLSKNFLNKSIVARDELSLPSNLVNHGRIYPEYSGPKPRIIFEDDTLIALSKPAGIHCHPLTYLESDNLLSYFAKERNYQILNVNQNNYDRGLMYRLDLETSGLVVFIKNDDTYHFIREHFRELVDKKIYYAVVSGAFDGESDIQTLLKPSGVKGRKIVEDSNLNADTKFSRLKIIEARYSPDRDETLLKIELFQGHRHQIRAQLRAVGYPIKGDKLYGGEKARRLHLHCFRYKFKINEKTYDLTDDQTKFLSEFFDFNS